MRSSSIDDGKKVTLISSVREINRVTEANQFRLQHLELAVANLTSICNALRNDIRSLVGLSLQGSDRKVPAEANGMKRRSSVSSSPGLDLKDEMLGVQMQQLLEQAAALGILKGAKTTPTKEPGNVKTDLRELGKLAPKNVQATMNQKSSAKSLVQTKDSTTEKNMSLKLARVKNIVATQPKAKCSPQSPVKNMKATTATARVSLTSTVKKTRTTISKVYVKPATIRGKERPNTSLKSTVKNVETVKGKGSIKLTIKGKQGEKFQTATSSHAMMKTSSLSGTTTVTKSDVRPRRKWSTNKEITLKK